MLQYLKYPFYGVWAMGLMVDGGGWVNGKDSSGQSTVQCQKGKRNQHEKKQNQDFQMVEDKN